MPASPAKAVVGLSVSEVKQLSPEKRKAILSDDAEVVRLLARFK